MRYILILPIFILFFSCHERNSLKDNIELPDSTLINEVISIVIKTDSLWKNCTVSNKMKVQKLYKKVKWENDSTPPPPPPEGPFSISYDELFSFFGSEKNFDNREKDSLYISRQINSSRQYFVSKSNIEYFSKYDDSYYQFYLPIFSNDKKVVYVFYGRECGPLCGAFYEIVLKRTNNMWIKVHGDLVGGR